MRQYLDLMSDVRFNGIPKEQRATLLSTQQRPEALSLFGRQIRFDLAAGFPMVTTRKIRFDFVVGELLWFLSGSTNVNDLHCHGVRFWDEWADPDTGDLGPVYGKQWRRWEGRAAKRWTRWRTWCATSRPSSPTRTPPRRGG